MAVPTPRDAPAVLAAYTRVPNATFLFEWLNCGTGRSADWLEASSVPKYLRARAPHDDGEARKVRRRPACPGGLDRAGPARAAELGRARRILRAEKVRWRRTRSWAASTDPEFAPKGPQSWSAIPPRRRAPR